MIFENPTARAEQRRRQMLKEVEELARDAGHDETLALCKELRQWEMTRYLGRHPQWHVIRDLHSQLND